MGHLNYKFKIDIVFLGHDSINLMLMHRDVRLINELASTLFSHPL